MIDLKPVPRGANSYCGPAAIAALTGLTTGEAARQIRRLTGQRYVKGADIGSVLGVLRRNGIASDLLLPPSRSPRNIQYAAYDRVLNLWDSPKTIGQLCSGAFDTLRHDYPAYLVLVTMHYIVVSGDRFVDNHHREPLHVVRMPNKRRRIVRLVGCRRKD
jgi:hypothetical protein